MIRGLLFDYEKLLHKKFIIGLEGSQKIEFEFKNVNFMHLIGLHKLDDISVIQKFNDKNNKVYNAKRIYSDIKSGTITDDELMASSNIEEILESRLNYFSSDTIMRLVHNDEIIHFNPNRVQFENGKSTKLEEIDYIFFETIKTSDENYLQFCIGFDKKDTKNHPSTFFMEKSNLYVYNQECKNVVSLYITSTVGSKFVIYWNNVRLSMKKNSHYKWLVKKGEIYDFDINELKREDIDKLRVNSDDDLNEVKRHFELLRLDEIKMVYLPYIPEAEKWNNGQKRYLVNYIDTLDDKSVTPNLIQQKIKEIIHT